MFNISEQIKNFFGIFLNIDKELITLIHDYGIGVYGFLFGVLFMETGLVVVPFLPGDSLLFTAGALAALNLFNLGELYLIVFLAVFLGDTVNYWIGRFIGPKAFRSESKLLKKEYLNRTQDFYKKHGGKTIVLARFVPIIRTFAPFVAGISKMKYDHFIIFNIIGGLAWTAIFIFSGYFLGNIPFIKENFHYMVLAIIALSFIPVAFEIIKNKNKI